MSRILYLNERAQGSNDSPMDTYFPFHPGEPPVPYISKIDRDLYVGGVNPTLVLPPWIEYVVSMHPVEYRATVELEGYALFKASDHEKQDPRAFLLASDVAAGFWEAGPTLIHCAAGLNRAPTVAALVLMDVKGMSSHTAIETLRSARSESVLYNDTFVDFLHSQDKIPAAKNLDDSDFFSGPIEGLGPELDETKAIRGPLWRR